MVNLQNGAAPINLAVPTAAFQDTRHTDFYLPTGVSLEHPSVKSLLKRGLDILGALVGLAFTAIIFVTFPVL